MEKKKKTAAIIGCALLVLILVAVIIVLVILLVRKDEPGNETGEGQVYVIDEDNYLQIMEDMEADVREGYFETYMNTEWTFADGTSETKDAILGNSPNNTKPIRYEVILEGTGETVFSTGVMPVGAQLPPFKLDSDLEAGTYNAVCMVYLLDEAGDGTYTDYSSAGFNVTIVVEN